VGSARLLATGKWHAAWLAWEWDVARGSRYGRNS